MPNKTTERNEKTASGPRARTRARRLAVRGKVPPQERSGTGKAPSAGGPDYSVSPPGPPERSRKRGVHTTSAGTRARSR